MNDEGRSDRGPHARVTRKIVVTLIASGLTYLVTNLTNQPQVWALTISLLIGGIALVVQFMHDFERRLENVELKQETHASAMHSLIRNDSAKIHSLIDQRSAETHTIIEKGFARTSEAAELFQAVEASALRTDAVTELVRHSTRIRPDSAPLVCGFAQAQITRMSLFMKELSEGGEVSYDGEDRDWILGLAGQCQHSIDAASLSTVDAGGNGYDGGLWTSDFGQRYLAVQRDAILRGVAIRRVFILDSSGLTTGEDFLRVYRQQRQLGIQTKVLDRSTIPINFRHRLFDFIVFDKVVSYEVTPASRVEDTMKPAIVKTHLALQPEWVEERITRFEDLWDAAQRFDED